jgi:hypothetical protein
VLNWRFFSLSDVSMVNDFLVDIPYIMEMDIEVDFLVFPLPLMTRTWIMLFMLFSRRVATRS